MRFKSRSSNGYQVFAVSGVNTISFGIQASEEARAGLLGFAVERIDPDEDERYIMPGFKVFPSIVPNPASDMLVSTWDHPVQSFIWDDFTAKPKHEYEYLFYPVKGKPKKLDRSREPIHIRVKTEPLYTDDIDGPHDVFFNRGVASSQAYQRKFGNLSLNKLPKDKKDEALQWLTRDLDEAILRFIRNAQKGDTLLGCFYEFRYPPVAQAIKAALDREVDVQLILDAKLNEGNFPRDDNIAMLNEVGLPIEPPVVTLREARPNAIQHNKFMVLIRAGVPKEVWTGSTNISLGGFSGQTNVGHWVRDPQTAEQFCAYWNLLKTDPGAKDTMNDGEKREANKKLLNAVATLHDIPTSIDRIPPGTTTVFSPRAGLQILDLYVRLVDSAQKCSCITLAFGISAQFKQQLIDNTSLNPIVFMLLEKKDSKNPRSKKTFVPLNAANNVYQAWGSYLRDPVYQWARETNAQVLRLNSHVVYVHSKFLLMDPLGQDPIVVTGSANFSEASTNNNDENMLIIRGNQRVADIYFTEFNRLFNHYYFRSIVEITRNITPAQKPDSGLLLAEDSETWLKKYEPGKDGRQPLRAKRLQLYTGMEGAVTL